MPRNEEGQSQEHSNAPFLLFALLLLVSIMHLDLSAWLFTAPAQGLSSTVHQFPFPKRALEDRGITSSQSQSQNGVQCSAVQCCVVRYVAGANRHVL